MPTATNWHRPPSDPLEDIRAFARLTMWVWEVPPALVVNVDEEIIAEEQRRVYFADLIDPRQASFDELRLVMQPRTIRVPIEQFSESVMVGKVRRDADDATQRARWRV